MSQVLDLPQQKLIDIFQRQHVVFAAVFGSYAKAKARKTSDVDILIEFDPQVEYSLFDLVRMKDNVETLLNKKVDLVTMPALHPLIKKEVFNTMKVLYDKR